jgi:hypothetical protein
MSSNRSQHHEVSHCLGQTDATKDRAAKRKLTNFAGKLALFEDRTMYGLEELRARLEHPIDFGPMSNVVPRAS